MEEETERLPFTVRRGRSVDFYISALCVSHSVSVLEASGCESSLLNPETWTVVRLFHAVSGFESFLLHRVSDFTPCEAEARGSQAAQRGFLGLFSFLFLE